MAREKGEVGAHIHVENLVVDHSHSSVVSDAYAVAADHDAVAEVADGSHWVVGHTADSQSHASAVVVDRTC